MTDNILDMFIIGGGINGAGIARDAAGRGASVMLVEQNDLASATSSASSKLIHGGLRYLEYYQFSLVRKALIEREYLLKSAPHIIWPARFVLPHAKHLRPRWLIRLGLFFYDSLNLKQSLKKSRNANLTKEAYGDALKAEYKAGFVYSDCRVHDSRLVLANLQDAAQKGATIHLNTKFISADIKDGLWHIIIENNDAQQQEIIAKTLINAAGPWVDNINEVRLKMDVKGATRLVTGSHIIVPKIYEGAQCYLFQNEDNRIVFAIPYENEFTMIGTTDKAFEGNPSEVDISEQEIDYLCEISNQYFNKSISASDIVWHFAGVRSLFDDHAKDAKSVTRDYVLDIHHADGQPANPPLLSVYGGKITTFRHLSAAVSAKLKPYLPNLGADWTLNAKLPGGDIKNNDIGAFIEQVALTYDFLPNALVKRLVTHYGSKIYDILADAKSLDDLGDNLGCDIYCAELDYAIKHEWVTKGADYYWRRTRMGLHMSDDVKTAVDKYIENHI